MRTLTFVYLFALLAVPGLALLPVPCLASDDPVVLVDFETGEPADGWSFSGLTLSETTVEPGKTISGGRCLTLTGEDDKDTRVGYIYRDIPVNDWRKFRALSLHARVDARSPIELRIIAWDGCGGRGMLKRFKLEAGDWREIVLPLSEWREEIWDFVGDFRQVKGIELRWDEGTGTVTIDDLRLLPGKKGNLSCRPTVEQLTTIAFPEGKTKAHESKHFRLITNATRFKGKEGKKVVGRLEEVAGLLEDKWRLSGEIEEPVPFLVFKKVEQFREFFTWFGKAFGMDIPPPATEGCCLLGVPASVWSAETRWERPLYVRLATSVIARRRIGLSGTKRNWVRAGLATAVQVHYYPASWSRDEIKNRFAELAAGEGSWLPWDKLLAEKSPGSVRHAQLATIFQFLADRHAGDLPKFWEALKGADKWVHECAAALLSESLGKTIADLEAEWLEWGKNEFYGK